MQLTRSASFAISICELGTAFAADVAITVAAGDAFAHLQRTVDWYGRVRSSEHLADTSSQVLLRDRLHGNTLRAVQLGFDFARADAAALRTAPQPAPTTDSTATPQSHNLEQAATQAAERVTNVEARIRDLDAMVLKAPEKSRETLLAQRRELEAELSLAKEIAATVRGVVSFAGSGATPGATTGQFTAQIESLERTVPEARHDTSAHNATAAKAVSASESSSRPEFEGLIGLTVDLLTAERARIEIKSLLDETDQLLASADRLKAPFVGSLQSLVNRSESITSAASSEDAAQIAAGQREIDALTAQFKQFSGVTVPLNEQQIVIAAVRGDLAEMRAAFKQRSSEAWRYLILRLGVMILAIITILALSSGGRRLIFRYVHDPRRRRQVLVLRRVIVSCAVALVLILGFVTEFGSLATYAGFLTAGIAVALQNVILAVIGYFFLIGRYGVRVGDRVTIAGVTGNVIEVGLVRIYLLELVPSGSDMHATGRMVVFSNSILFQPNAIYKQMPGADYIWHTVRLTLVRETDFEAAEQRLNEAVAGVYRGYQEQIEKQYEVLERSVDIPVSSPAPEGHLRLTEGGLEFTSRYPVVLKLAAETDDYVLKAIYGEISREPRLELVSGGEPKILSSVV